MFYALFSFLLLLNSQGSGLDVPDADLETDEDLVSASNTRGHCETKLCAGLCRWGKGQQVHAVGVESHESRPLYRGTLDTDMVIQMLC